MWFHLQNMKINSRENKYLVGKVYSIWWKMTSKIDVRHNKMSKMMASCELIYSVLQETQLLKCASKSAYGAL